VILFCIFVVFFVEEFGAKPKLYLQL